MERSGSLERSNSVERGSLSRQGSTEKPPKEPDEGITEDLDPTELKVTVYNYDGLYLQVANRTFDSNE